MSSAPALNGGATDWPALIQSRRGGRTEPSSKAPENVRVFRRNLSPMRAVSGSLELRKARQAGGFQ
jgi:hypothetical protein